MALYEVKLTRPDGTTTKWQSVNRALAMRNGRADLAGVLIPDGAKVEVTVSDRYRGGVLLATWWRVDGKIRRDRTEGGGDYGRRETGHADRGTI